jgi:hypothetical protein
MHLFAPANQTVLTTSVLARRPSPGAGVDQLRNVEIACRLSGVDRPHRREFSFNVDNKAVKTYRKRGNIAISRHADAFLSIDPSKRFPPHRSPSALDSRGRLRCDAWQILKV